MTREEYSKCYYSMQTGIIDNDGKIIGCRLHFYFLQFLLDRPELDKRLWGNERTLSFCAEIAVTFTEKIRKILTENGYDVLKIDVQNGMLKIDTNKKVPDEIIDLIFDDVPPKDYFKVN